MNLTIIIPNKWNPNRKNAFNRWISRVNKYVERKKIKK